MREFSDAVLEDESGGHITVAPELSGCHTQGDRLDEVIKNVREAIEPYLETPFATVLSFILVCGGLYESPYSPTMRGAYKL